MSLIGACGPVQKIAVSQCQLRTSCVILSSKGVMVIGSWRGS